MCRLNLGEVAPIGGGEAALPVPIAVRNLHQWAAMFAFYSNQLGCLGSILVSLVGTVLLAALLYMMVGR